MCASFMEIEGGKNYIDNQLCQQGIKIQHLETMSVISREWYVNGSECSFHTMENKIYFDFWYFLVMKLRQNCSKISVVALYLHEAKRDVTDEYGSLHFPLTDCILFQAPL